MLNLPAQISVQLVDGGGKPLRQNNVLVGLNLLRNGRYYYGNLIGLTSTSGTVTISGVEIERRYLRDQLLYPSDYKLELVECDSDIEVLLLSGADIERAREGIRENDQLEPFVPTSYARARNRDFRPTLARVSTEARTQRELYVYLTTTVTT